MTMREAVTKVLSEHNGPMRTRDIWATILKRGYYKGVGKTPYRTMTAQLITDVSKRGDGSLFVRHGFGLYGLRRRQGHLSLIHI